MSAPRIEPDVAGPRPGFDILDADDSRRIVKRILKALNLAGGDNDRLPGSCSPVLVCASPRITGHVVLSLNEPLREPKMQSHDHLYSSSWIAVSAPAVES